MKLKKLLPASLLALLAAVLTFTLVFAHEHVPVGHYELVIGWAAEPAVVGQANALTIRVSDTTATDKDAAVDVSELTATIAYGGQTKKLSLEKSFGTTNEYEAHLIPMVAGKYTVQLRGKVGDADVNVDIEPEEVTPIDELAFPSVSESGNAGVSPAPAEALTANRNSAPAGFGLGEWLGITALLISLAGVGFAFAAYQKARA